MIAMEAPPRRGLSLLEVLVAIGLLMALGVALASFVGDLRRSRERIATAIERQRAADALLEEIERAIATTLVEDALLGTGLRGRADRLEVVSRTVAAWRLGDPSLRHLALEDRERLAIMPDGAERTRIERRGAAGGDGGRGELPIAIRFRYLDEGQWVESFDSVERGSLPRAVEITLWWSQPPPDAEIEPADLESQFGFEEEPLDDPPLPASPRSAAARGARAGSADAAPDRRRVVAIIDPAADAAWPLLLLRGARRRSAAASRRPTPRGRRGFVLLGVLVVVAIGLLLAGTTLLLVRGENASSGRAAEAVRARSLAWSGVQVAMAELAAQRPRILAGEAPQLDRQYTLFDEGPRLGVVRLLPVGPAGSLASPESSRLDLATIAAERLVASGVVEPELAAAVIAARDAARGGRLDAVEGLLSASAAVGGEGRAIRGEDLHGPLEELDLRRSLAGEEGDLAERVLDRLDQLRLRGLLDLLTVHAVEPWLDAEGSPRISIRPPWSEEMGAAIEASFDGRLAEAVRMVLAGEAIFDEQDIAEGLSLDSDRDLIELLVRSGAEIDEASRIFAGLTLDPAPIRTGRLDLNSAPLEAIRTLPGIEPEQAAAIVEIRETLSPQERLDPLWPARREIVRLDQYPQIIELVGVRSGRWRLRLACGSVDAEDPEGPIEQASIWEVVVDLAGDAVRLASIREITLIDLAARLSLHLPEVAEAGDPRAARRERILAASEPWEPWEEAVEAPEIAIPLPQSVPQRSPATPPSAPPSPRPASSESPPAAPPSTAGDSASGGSIGRWRRLP